MTEQEKKRPGRLARAALAARIAFAAVSPLAPAAVPVPEQGLPDAGGRTHSQLVERSTTKQLANAEAAQGRERRRQGLELGYQLKSTNDAVVEPSKKAPPRRGRR